MSSAALILPMVAVSAAALVLVPRPLFAEAGAAPPRALEATLSLGLAVFGLAVAIFGPGETLGARAVLAVALMALAAIVYGDLRFLIIPDVYTATLALIGLVGPLSPGLSPALAGAAVCGGLLAIVAWAFRRRTEVEGMGLGDVKLAAAAGALLGPQLGLWAITGSAILGVLVGLIWKRLRRNPETLLIPYGAALALAIGALVLGGRL